MRLAFWQNYGVKAHGSSSGVTANVEASAKAALLLCNQAQELFSGMKNRHAEGDCCLIKAACEQKEDKIQDVLTFCGANIDLTAIGWFLGAVEGGRPLSTRSGSVFCRFAACVCARHQTVAGWRRGAICD
jgi:hypothetical protein